MQWPWQGKRVENGANTPASFPSIHHMFVELNLQSAKFQPASDQASLRSVPS
jgi:hypothetical protein